jgi:hypothetical protein
MGTLSETSKDHAFGCMLNHGNILVQLLHCVSLSSCQLASTLPPATQLLLSQCQQGDLVGHHLWLSNVLERIFPPSRVNRFKRQTLPTINRKYFFMNIFRIEFFCLREMHNRILFFGIILLKHGRHFYYWNQPLNMLMRVCYLDWHEVGLCCYLVIHIVNLLRPLQLFYFH